MRVSLYITCKHGHSDKPRKKKFGFVTDNIVSWEESDFFEDHTFIEFKNGDKIEACVNIRDFEQFILPPNVLWRSPQK